MKNILKTLGVTLLVGLFSGQANAAPPQIFAGTNGEAEVVFSKNNCVVYYNKRGNRKESNRHCRKGQVKRADDAIVRYRREHGLGRPNHNHKPKFVLNVPVIEKMRGGYKVKLKHPRCVVVFTKRFVRSITEEKCTKLQIARAQIAMIRYRREQGL